MGNSVAAVAATSRRSKIALGLGIVALAAWCLLYVWLKAVPAPMSRVLEQVVFVLPPVVAALLAALAIGRTKRRSRERTVLRTLAWAMALLGAGEVAYSAYQLFIDYAGPKDGWPSDIFFVLGAACILWLLIVLAGAQSMPRPARVRMVADTVVFVALLCAFAFAIWGRVAADVLSFGVVTRLTSSFYSVQGIVALAVAGTLWTGGRTFRQPVWIRLLALGFVVYALGLLLWPVWQLAHVTGANMLADLGVELLLMLGYGLVGIACGLRAAGDDSWEPPSFHSTDQGLHGWPNVAVTAAAFTGMAVLFVVVLRQAPDSAGELVYLTALVAAGLGLLVESAASAFETRAEENRGFTDGVTGLGNQRRFDEAVSKAIARSASDGDPVALVVVDVDDFARVSGALGYVESDRVLAAVGASISAELPARSSVSRLSGDEFALVLPGMGRDEVTELARALVRRVRTDEPYDGLTVSAGVAVHPNDGQDSDELRAAAESALGWAKSHGKNRVVASSPGVAPHHPGTDAEPSEAELRLDLARGLAAAIDARDFGNPYHGRNVATLATFVARELGWDAERVDRLEAAGLLHDVGTLTLPDSVFESPGRAAMIRRHEHAELGARFCESIGFEDIAGWVRSHHERWDGSGYPDGLRGESIPVESRLLALCNGYDNLTRGRWTRGGLSQSAALQDIDLGIATRYDPELAEQFIAIVGAHDALAWEQVRTP